MEVDVDDDVAVVDVVDVALVPVDMVVLPDVGVSVGLLLVPYG